MEFTTLPPEVISALIHSGPGAESLANAAAAWQQLSANLEDAADNYASSLSSMDQAWYGPSSAAMVQSVTPYVTWLRTTAQQAQQTAAAAQSAAAAFSSVQASVVPTATVAANRMRLAQLLATNVYGRNLPAIAQTPRKSPPQVNPTTVVQFAETGHCREALPQLKIALPFIRDTDLKRRAGIAGVRCGMTINDPSTAINCVDQLSRILIRFGSRQEPASLRYDPPGILRVSIPWPGFDRLLDAAFDQIRLYSKADVAVSLRMLRALGDIATAIGDPAVQEALAERGRQIVAGCAEELAEEELGKLRVRLSALEKLALP